ncbi:MAG: hypothetical protein ACRD3T_01955, partial [Terriglobia bacterium]
QLAVLLSARRLGVGDGPNALMLDSRPPGGGNDMKGNVVATRDMKGNVVATRSYSWRCPAGKDSDRLHLRLFIALPFGQTILRPRQGPSDE